MTAPKHAPISDLVARAWLRMAVPGVGVGKAIPAADDTMRANGFIRTTVIPSTANQVVPMRQPVVSAECFFPPKVAGGTKVRANEAADLANRLWLATFNTALMGVAVDLSDVGNYEQARVHQVIALQEPSEVPDDPDNFGRYDLDLLILWTQGV